MQVFFLLLFFILSFNPWRWIEWAKWSPDPPLHKSLCFMAGARCCAQGPRRGHLTGRCAARAPSAHQPAGCVMMLSSGKGGGEGGGSRDISKETLLNKHSWVNLQKDFNRHCFNHSWINLQFYFIFFYSFSSMVNTFLVVVFNPSVNAFRPASQSPKRKPTAQKSTLSHTHLHIQILRTSP